MKTIAEIAAEIGVTKQAVHKKMKQEPLSTSLRELTTTKGTTFYVSVDGEALIKSAFSKEVSSTSSTEKVDKSTNQVDDLSTEFIASLREQVAFLTSQNEDLREQLNIERDHSRGQADKVIDLANQLAELSRNNQFLLGAEQSKTNPALLLGAPMGDQQDTPPTETKKNFLYRWFGR